GRKRVHVASTSGKRWFVTVAAALSALAPLTSVAQTPPGPAPARPRSALARVAEALAQDLARAPARALGAAAPIVSDGPAPGGAQLAGVIAAQIAGRRGAGSHARAEPLTLPAAREAAHGDAVLVHLAVEVAGGKLRVAADVYPVPPNVWARIRNPEPGPIAHA